jgi:SlyX protein
MNEDIEARLRRLEETVAHQAYTIDEMSGEMARQGRELDQVRTKLETMASRFLTLEEQVQESPPISKPPHY